MVEIRYMTPIHDKDHSNTGDLGAWWRVRQKGNYRHMWLPQCIGGASHDWVPQGLENLPPFLPPI